MLPSMNKQMNNPWEILSAIETYSRKDIEAMRKHYAKTPAFNHLRTKLETNEPLSTPEMLCFVFGNGDIGNFKNAKNFVNAVTDLTDTHSNTLPRCLDSFRIIGIFYTNFPSDKRNKFVNDKSKSAAFVNLPGKDLSNLPLCLGSYQYADLSECRFEDSATSTKYANLSFANCVGINGVKVDFTDGILINTNFHNADLPNANFTGANLHGAKFTGANLSHANFSNAVIRDADFSNANMHHTQFFPEDLSLDNLDQYLTLLKDQVINHKDAKMLFTCIADDLVERVKSSDYDNSAVAILKKAIDFYEQLDKTCQPPKVFNIVQHPLYQPIQSDVKPGLDALVAARDARLANSHTSTATPSHHAQSN